MREAPVDIMFGSRMQWSTGMDRAWMPVPVPEVAQLLIILAQVMEAGCYLPAAVLPHNPHPRPSS